jgi:hypothetical protein
MRTWLQWIFSKDRRVVKRQTEPGVVAYYWDGGEPQSHDIRDISASGLYLLTDDRWYPGTQVMVTLQRVGSGEADPDRSITVNTKVVRLGEDGVGIKLVMLEKKAHQGLHSVPLNGADRKAFQRFVRRVMGDRS